MHISIKNFKSHNKLDLDLPSTGLVRIHGKSGAGKSNILHAVLWSLYGKGTNVASYGESSVDVSVSIGDLSVSRTKGPNSITANNISGDEAQSVIDSALDMNIDEFMASSYVMQKMHNSLLSLSAQSQVELISKLSKCDEAEKIKDKIVQELKKEEDSLSVSEQSLDKAQGVLAAYSDNIERLKTGLQTTVLGLTYKDLCEQKESIRSQTEELTANLQSLSSEYRSLEQSKNSPARKTLARAEEFLVSAVAAIDSFQAQLTEIQNLEIEPPDTYMAQLNGLQATYREVAHKLKKIEEANQASKDGARAKAELESSWERAKQPLLSVDPDPSQALSRKIDIERFLTASDIYDRASGKMNPDMVSMESSLRTEAAELTCKLKEIKDLYQKSIEKSQTISRLQADILDLQKQQAKAEEVVARASLLEPIEVLELRIVDITQKINEINATLSGYKVEAVQIDSDIKILQSNSKIKQSGKELQEKIKEVKQSIEELSEQKKSHSLAISQLNSLKNLVHRANLDAVDAMVDEINARARYWCEELLDGEIYAELQTSKKLKSQKTVDKMSTVVYYKGEAVSMDSLSGGQNSRLTLAFNLALCDIYNTKILMLDESLSGTDEETMDRCFRAIQEASKNKLILMVEHGANNGNFDYTVHI